jgi:hypothetical protein
MNNTALELCFRGDRDYIYGPTIYAAITDTLAQNPSDSITNFKLVMHRFARNQCELFWGDARDAARSQDALATFEMKRETGDVFGWLAETSRPVDCRIPYDETPVWNACDVNNEDRRVSVGLDSSPLPIVDVVVSMNKYLHLKVLPGQRWVVTGFNINRLFAPDDCQKLSVQLRNQLGTRHTKSEIYAHGESIGFITFTSVTIK